MRVELYSTEAFSLYNFVFQLKKCDWRNRYNGLNVSLLNIVPKAKVDNPEWGKTTNLIELVASLPRIIVLILDKFVFKVLAGGTVSKSFPAIKHLWYLRLADINFADTGGGLAKVDLFPISLFGCLENRGRKKER
ncbi:uncharacterized protein LOC132273999 isoform X2 [Cornus florida]|uniref:uncharacterized protein LOC132273999 isoform X2 n=1 Tax=Cornus florida TaxID=4283 RepID=UPI0028A28BEC|nr:uncharacterized protein LOC132273999 isoform X2 [Cornus florida]XP_059631119.1 uncharacterized protein LOC132273999 isoform X2 [Cornus florida]